MNGLGKAFRKNPIQKIEKTVKISVKLPHVNKKPLPRNRIFVRTPYSHYFKIRAKRIHAAKPLAFSLHFLFRRDQNHYSNLTSKIMKMCEQILKKNIAGRIPETTRSENPFNAIQLLIKQNVPSLIYDYLETKP